MTSDPRSGDPFQSGPGDGPGDPFQPGPDDVTAAHPVAPVQQPVQPAPLAWGQSPISGSGPGSDPFERPLQRPMAAPVAAAPVRARGGGMLVNVVLGIALVVAVGGLAFAGGRATAPTSATPGRTGFGANGQGGFGPGASGAPGGALNGGLGAGAGGVSIQGTVTAVSADSITLQLPSGQSITIPTDGQTTYHERSAATAAAVTSGSTVIVQLQAGRGAFGQGGNGGGNGGGATASGAPGRTLGPATTVTVVPTGS